MKGADCHEEVGTGNYLIRKPPITESSRLANYLDQRRGSRATACLATVQSGPAKRRIPLIEGLFGRRTTFATRVLDGISEPHRINFCRWFGGHFSDKHRVWIQQRLPLVLPPVGWQRLAPGESSAACSEMDLAAPKRGSMQL
jgi:hypothetical protein